MSGGESEDKIISHFERYVFVLSSVYTTWHGLQRSDLFGKPRLQDVRPNLAEARYFLIRMLEGVPCLVLYDRSSGSKVNVVSLDENDEEITNRYQDSRTGLLAWSVCQSGRNIGEDDVKYPPYMYDPPSETTNEAYISDTRLRDQMGTRHQPGIGATCFLQWEEGGSKKESFSLKFSNQNHVSLEYETKNDTAHVFAQESDYSRQRYQCKKFELMGTKKNEDLFVIPLHNFNFQPKNEYHSMQPFVSQSTDLNTQPSGRFYIAISFASFRLLRFPPYIRQVFPFANRNPSLFDHFSSMVFEDLESPMSWAAFTAVQAQSNPAFLPVTPYQESKFAVAAEWSDRAVDSFCELGGLLDASTTDTVDFPDNITALEMGKDVFAMFRSTSVVVGGSGDTRSVIVPDHFFNPNSSTTLQDIEDLVNRVLEPMTVPLKERPFVLSSPEGTVSYSLNPSRTIVAQNKHTEHFFLLLGMDRTGTTSKGLFPQGEDKPVPTTSSGHFTGYRMDDPPPSYLHVRDHSKKIRVTLNGTAHEVELTAGEYTPQNFVDHYNAVAASITATISTSNGVLIDVVHTLEYNESANLLSIAVPSLVAVNLSNDGTFKIETPDACLALEMGIPDLFDLGVRKSTIAVYEPAKLANHDSWVPNKALGVPSILVANPQVDVNDNTTQLVTKGHWVEHDFMQDVYLTSFSVRLLQFLFVDDSSSIQFQGSVDVQGDQTIQETKSSSAVQTEQINTVDYADSFQEQLVDVPFYSSVQKNTYETIPVQSILVEGAGLATVTSKGIGKILDPDEDLWVDLRGVAAFNTTTGDNFTDIRGVREVVQIEDDAVVVKIPTTIQAPSSAQAGGFVAKFGQVVIQKLEFFDPGLQVGKMKLRDATTQGEITMGVTQTEQTINVDTSGVVSAPLDLEGTFACHVLLSRDKQQWFRAHTFSVTVEPGTYEYSLYKHHERFNVLGTQLALFRYARFVVDVPGTHVAVYATGVEFHRSYYSTETSSLSMVEELPHHHLTTTEVEKNYNAAKYTHHLEFQKRDMFGHLRDVHMLFSVSESNAAPHFEGVHVEDSGNYFDEAVCGCYLTREEIENEDHTNTDENRPCLTPSCIPRDVYKNARLRKHMDCKNILMQVANFQVADNGRLNVGLKQQTGDKQIKKHDDVMTGDGEDFSETYDVFSVVLIACAFLFALVLFVTVYKKLKNRQNKRKR